MFFPLVQFGKLFVFYLVVNIQFLPNVNGSFSKCMPTSIFSSWGKRYFFASQDSIDEIKQNDEMTKRGKDENFEYITAKKYRHRKYRKVPDFADDKDDDVNLDYQMSSKNGNRQNYKVPYFVDDNGSGANTFVPDFVGNNFPEDYCYPNTEENSVSKDQYSSKSTKTTKSKKRSYFSGYLPTLHEESLEDYDGMLSKHTWPYKNENGATMSEKNTTPPTDLLENTIGK
eukprot:359781_1